MKASCCDTKHFQGLSAPSLEAQGLYSHTTTLPDQAPQGVCVQGCKWLAVPILQHPLPPGLLQKFQILVKLHNYVGSK